MVGKNLPWLAGVVVVVGLVTPTGASAEPDSRPEPNPAALCVNRPYCRHSQCFPLVHAWLASLHRSPVEYYTSEHYRDIPPTFVTFPSRCPYISPAVAASTYGGGLGPMPR